MTTLNHRAALHLSAPVHVFAGGDVVPVRRKGLAIMAYVALEGPTSRERLADVLWGHRQSLRNLRVELHRLRSVFASTGVEPLTKAVDPLALTSSIDVAHGHDPNGFLVGLEDISSEYQAWLEYRRGLVTRHNGRNVHLPLLDDLERNVEPPFVVVLQGLPGAGRRTLARTLARRLSLPYVEDPRTKHAGLRYVAPEHHTLDGLAERVRADPSSVWVIGRSAFGEDSRLLLQLRASVPPERWRFHQLEPLTWPETKRAFLDGMGFHEGATLFLAAGGNPGYLTELLALRERSPLSSPLPIPQRMRAAIALEARHLGESARQALERLSVHAGTFTPALLEALDAAGSVDELERSGWLRYDGSGWRISDPLAASLLCGNLRVGQRVRLLQQIAAHVQVDSGNAGEATPLHLSAVRRPGRGPVGNGAPDEPTLHAARREPLRFRQMARGSEVLLEEPDCLGAHVVADGTLVLWSRLASADGVASVTWPLPGEALLVRVAGRVQVGAEHAGERTTPLCVLRLSVSGMSARTVAFAQVEAPLVASDGSAWLPAARRFDHWLLLPAGASELRMACDLSGAVVEADVSAYRPHAATTADRMVDAIDLSPSSKPRRKRAENTTERASAREP